MRKVTQLERKVIMIRQYSFTRKLCRLIRAILRLCSIEDSLLTNLASSILPSKITQLRFKSTPKMLSPTIIRAYLWIGEAIMTKQSTVSLQLLASNQERLTFITTEALHIVSSAIMSRQSLTTPKRSNWMVVTLKLSTIEPSVGTKQVICRRQSKTICKQLDCSPTTCKRCTIWEQWLKRSAEIISN